MKRIRINKGYVGLVFKNGDYKKIITEGVYWLGFNERVRVENMAQVFLTPVELNILLKDEKFAQLVTVIDVQDNEIAIVYKDGKYHYTYGAGKQVYWNGLVDIKYDIINIENNDQITDIAKNILQKSELIARTRVFAVESYERGILLIDGKFEKVLDTGVYYFWKNSIPVAVLKADMRQQQMEISGQEILTSDKAALRVNYFTQYVVKDIVKALTQNKDFEKQLYIIMQLALREFIGTLTLDEILEKKDCINQYVIENVKEKVAKLGIEIKDSGVRDIILPGDVKEIMNQVLIAQKKAQANIITRREETASTRSLLNTAKLMEDNQMLFKLKEMEYVEKIAERINNISLSGGNQIVEQLKDIFAVK